MQENDKTHVHVLLNIYIKNLLTNYCQINTYMCIFISKSCLASLTSLKKPVVMDMRIALAQSD